MNFVKRIITIMVLCLALMASMQCKNSSSSEDDVNRIDTVYVWQDNLLEIDSYYWGVKESDDGVDSLHLWLKDISPCDTCPGGWDRITFAWGPGDFYLFHAEDE